MNKESRARFISEETFHKLHCTEIFAGDCLVSRLPDPIGRSCILPQLPGRMITAVDCTILRFDKKQLDPRYFVYYSLSRKYQNSILLESTGSTRKRISRKKLEALRIPIPPLSEQLRIVEKLDALYARTQKLEQIYTKKLANLEELKQSVLQQVFGGKL